ncbi:DNA repair protein RecO [Mangrovimonas futianensis]|uniref:DNA repair protein RecO n=1 Tax=Mangrovimonas futianensis TaxID=2895523 RepID=UPI001E31DD9D|nr:DNA repair protein RecO [Mangrovimonas futianensis]MCF1420701.1 DNA repair protein RecO [Mangrovimonas futianensis]
MIAKTKGIVLSSIKYQDHDLIVRCYTEKFGTISFLLKGVMKSKRGSKNVAFFQPLTQLQLDVKHQLNRNLHYIQEVKVHYIYETLHSNIIKGSLGIFLAEVLSSSLKEEEPNENLFAFIETAFQWLDQESHFANFHLLFLLNLSKHLGFYPDDYLKEERFFFNLQEGKFEKEQPKRGIAGTQVDLLKTLMDSDIQSINLIKLNASQRQEFLNTLLLYYELHLEGFRKPKSLEVFNQLFH